MEFLGDYNLPDIIGTGSIFKLLFLVIIVGYVIYALLLTFRVRILSDTVNSATNKIVNSVVYAHLLVAVVGSLLAVILILLG